ncbi:TonB-dependent receptor [Sphingomonas sp. BIUV-7]|uniref:TonB-dependent receptor n=1 Tax=Sphingomonas natans TaxID=3063330 RepID=A0ABT8Y8N6_9SPHN|nr:TonB-dependent receptor [Sphingomonas sp. BIUV-7]MDO6414686.1 TonB-dependent receptor [Sphingomonas sp. BIUV-7]
MRFGAGFRSGLMLGGAIFVAMPAVAAAAAPADAAGAADVAPPSEDQALGEIVVTATKRETNLQQTPISISVVNAAAVEDRHIQSLYDLSDGSVPSLRVATFEARQSALTIGIRGIVPLDANQPAREQGVGIYIDGVYLGRQHGLNAGLFDIERVEVLKGPQGTLFGRNTEGGALSIVTKAPTGEFGGRVTAGIGNLNSYNGDLHIDLPAFHDFAVKVDAIKQYQGAVTKNPLEGQKGFGYFDRVGGRVAVRWKPAELDITDDFSADYAQDKNTPFYSQLLNYNPNGCVAGPQAAVAGCALPGTQYTTLTGTVRPTLPGVIVEGDKRQRTADIGVPQQPSVDKTHGFTNTLKWKAADEIEIRAISAWRGVDATQFDNSGGAHRPPIVNLTTACTVAAPCGFSRYSLASLHQDQFSQELQAVGSVGTFDYVAGLYYFNERVSDDAATPNSNGVALVIGVAQYLILDPCRGSAGFGSQLGCRNIDRASAVQSKSYAAYGQVTWNATDAIHITAGGRYTEDKKKGQLLISRGVTYALNTTAAAAAGYTPLDEKWHRFNPMATVAFDATDDIHLYAKYATGYRAGGASSRTQNYQAFDPEDVKSYEIGAKTDFFDHKARLNLAGYIMDRKDSQVDISSIQFFNGSSFNNLVTINVPGNTKIRGIEADLTVRPTRGLTLSAGYAYTYTKIPLVPITYTGGGATTSVLQQFYIVYTPRNAGNGAIDYELPIGGAGTKVRFHFDGNYAQATQAFDQYSTKADASTIFNGRIALTDIPMGEGGQKLTISAWSRNLFNKAYVYRRDPSNSLPAAPTTSATTGNIGNVLGDYGNFNMPRTFGLEGTVNF